jgi:hypothetical protein
MSATDRVQTRSMKLTQPTTASAFLESVHPGGEQIPHQPRAQAINQSENCSEEAECSVCEVHVGDPVDEQVAGQLQTLEIGHGGNHSTEAEWEVNAGKTEQGTSTTDEVAELRAKLAAAEARAEEQRARAEEQRARAEKAEAAWELCKTMISCCACLHT